MVPAIGPEAGDDDLGTNNRVRGDVGSLHRRGDTGKWARPFMRRQIGKAGEALQVKVGKRVARSLRQRVSNDTRT
jgi:hypothetical protein